MIKLRHSTVDDAGAIARVQALSWQATYRGMIPQDYLDAIDVDAWAERHRGHMLEEPEGFVSYMAEEEGEIVGWALGGPNRDQRMIYSAELFTIYLLPGYERRGIGRMLMNAVARGLMSLGFESMIVWVLRDNWAAREFYEALGGAYVVRGVMDLDGTDVPVVSYGWRNLGVLLEATEPGVGPLRGGRTGGQRLGVKDGRPRAMAL